MAQKLYLSDADLVTLANRIAAVFLKQADFNTAIADYSTTTQMNSAITSAIAGVTQFDYEIVEELPQEGEKGVIYLVANSGSGSNIYDEYIWIVSGTPAVGHFELFGTQMVELIEYKGSGTITVTDGTGADAGKKIVAVKYDSNDFTTDASAGLQLTSAHKTSLGLADTALQGVTSTGSTIDVTGSGTTKNLEVSSTIVNGAAAGATALQSVASADESVAVSTSGTAIDLSIGSIGSTTINNLWTA